MSLRLLRRSLWSALALGALLTSTTACGEDEERAAALAKLKASKGLTGPGARVQRAPAAQVPTQAAASAAPSQPEQPKFKFTMKPKVGKIPNEPLFAQRDGEPWVIESVVFEPRGAHWTMSFHDVALPHPTGMARGSQTLTLQLPFVPQAGERAELPEQTEGLLWRVPALSAMAAQEGEGSPASANLVDWQPAHALAIEIFDWAVEPYQADGPAFQVAGHASGRITLTLRGEGERQSAYVVGRFNNAIVRYMGRPSAGLGKINEPAPPKKKAK